MLVGVKERTDRLAPVERAPRPASSGVDIGHVHLRTADIDRIHDFYVGILGFDVVARMPDALFVSAGGYHHHLAMNTWQSRGAQGRWPALGLGEVTIELPTDDERGALGARLAIRGIATRDDGRVLAFEDPWNNEIRVVVAS